jgi:endo-1,4-beta-xylanase
MSFKTFSQKWFWTVGFASLFAIVAAISSCNVNEADVWTNLKLQLNDSLAVEQGKYDSVRIDIYGRSEQPFIDGIFHGPYIKARDSVQLANLSLGKNVPDPLIIRITGYGKNGSIAKLSMSIVGGVASEPNVVLIPANKPDSSAPKSIVFLTSNPLNLTVGDPGVLLGASVLPTGAGQGLKWTTSNPAVATLSGKGSGSDSVHPGIAGNAILTATSTVDTTVSASLFVVVSLKIDAPKSIAIQTVSPLNLSLSSLPVALSASVLPVSADPRIEWISQSTLIASIENGNFVRPLSVGTATLVARSIGDTSVKGTLAVKVQADVIVPEAVRITNSDPLFLSVGGASIPLQASISPPGANQAIAFTSSDPSIALITIDNQVKGIKPGDALITAASVANSSLSDTLHITVQSTVILPETLVLESSNPLVLILGSASVPLKTKINPAGASQEVTWVSANPSIAALENDNFAAPVAVGETQFTATSKANTSLKQTLVVRVQAPVIVPKTIALLVPDTMRLAVGGVEGALAAEVGPVGAKQDINWSVADTTVAILTATKTVKALKAGKTVITAKVKEDPNLTKTLVVEVIAPVVVSGISMLPKTLTLYTGGATEKVTVTLQGNDPGAKYTLSSSDPLTASVKSDGTVTGIKAGRATISASPVGYPTLVATCDVEVKTDAPVIQLSPSKDTTIAYGGQVVFKVSVTQANGTVAEIKADLDGNGAYDTTVLGKATASFTAKYSTVNTVNTKFEVKDSEGNVVSLTRKITVSPPGVPEVTITDPNGPITIKVKTYTVKFSVKDPATGLTTQTDSVVTGLVAGLNTITVKRTNAGGQGKASVNITVDTTKTVVGAHKYFGNTTTRGQVRADFGTYFNQITPENESKWGTVEKVQDQMSWAGANAVATYAKSAGIPWSFYTLLWGSQLPSWFTPLAQAEQLTEITEWMDESKKQFPDIPIIYVVNEAAPNHTATPFAAALGGAGTSGYDWIFNAFKMARARWPNAVLVLNDYNNLEVASTLDWTVNVVAAAKQANVPIDAIGCEAHSLSTKTAANLAGSLDKLAATGLPILITEFDIANTVDTLQANKIKELFPVMWQHPSVVGVTYWGYVEGATWINGSHLLTTTGAERPSMTWLKTYIAANPTPPNNFPDLLK